MAEPQRPEHDQPTRKPLVWLHGEVKTPPFTPKGRQEAGMLLRLLQEGEKLGMPLAEPLPDVGARCGALRERRGAQLADRVPHRRRRRIDPGRVSEEDAEDP